jgi:uncharacterized protein YeaO (DUF488 family)
MTIRLKRAYDPPAEGDGVRVLVDRLWPRGVSKAEAKIDRWAKDIAPTPGLRKWFGHDPAKWAEFQKRYRRELTANADPVAELRRLIGRRTATLVYAAKDPDHNHAVVLRKYLLAKR